MCGICPKQIGVDVSMTLNPSTSPSAGAAMCLERIRKEARSAARSFWLRP